MSIIHEADPRRFRRVVSDIRLIAITRARSAAEYIRAASACFLDARYVELRTPEVVAAAIVHEATHARIDRRGIRARADLRVRIERRCVREEIAFLSRLDNSAPLVASLTERLSEPWWTDDLVFQKRVEQLRRLGVPNWLLRAHGFLFRPG